MDRGRPPNYCGRVRSIFRRLTALLLCVSMMPGGVELIENIEHLIHDGHLAHMVAHDEHEDVASHEALEAEHGCTPVSHTCGCHTSVPVILPDDLELRAIVRVVLRERPPELEDHPVCRANAPPVPPPRARVHVTV